VRFALYIPNLGEFADDVRVVAEIAREAEDGGWDGIFVWDSVNTSSDQLGIADPWVMLAAIAMRTESVRIGTMITPLARRRPTKVARETMTLDRLSRGRLTLGVGLGGAADSENDREFAWFGEDSDASIRAAKLDESLDILIGLWSGEHFSYSGRHNRVGDSTFLPVPVQQPRIPVWVGGVWPGKRPMRRAARFDGVIPATADFYDGGYVTPNQVAEILAYIDQQRANASAFDFAFVAGYPDNEPDPHGEMFEQYVEAGVTWWLLHATGLEHARSLARSGPPRRT
jgi:alkanesulfonate monooxygenase SsuD/methylene tetrahydromethanopterin reductase-like flavin-dependent oxidoreductase (luciferase family)